MKPGGRPKTNYLAKLRIPPHSGGMRSFAHHLLLVCCLAIAALSAGSARPSHAQAPTVVYADALSAGWESWSWDSTIDVNATAFVRGSKSIAVTHTAGWGALSLRTESPLPAGSYSAIQFWIHAGTTAPMLSVSVQESESGGILTQTPITVTPNAWSMHTVPLTALGDPGAIARINFQSARPTPQAVYYVDDLVFLPAAPGQATATPEAGPALSVDAALDRAPINPHIYGMNFGAFLANDEALADELDLPVRRWGGNSVTRYNWRLDTINTASDYYFQNIRNENVNTTTLPVGSASDRFVEVNKRTGTDSIITIPMIGWTAKRRVENHPYDCGYSIAKYGPQQSSDPYDTDCGNGVRLDNSLIITNTPTDTSIAVGPEFGAAWVSHLVGRFGNAQNGGVRFYNLDNEPMLWNSTHRDVHPQPVGYDELYTRTISHALAIKQADPGAQLLGPVLFGWTAYWHSAKDVAAGGAWWQTRPDRMAHGDVPFAPWYLRQMQAYQQANGVRLLDYFDLHYYPQANGVSLSPAGDLTTQALRLRSTRSLWDPDYADESWINGTEGGPAVRLIPRMREWVDANYPGTKLAVTEYNWGALDHINGALAQADVLGIFGREGVDLATLWSPPTSAQPGAFAFRMFRNYDGAGGKFGDTRVRAVSADQSKLAIYAAQERADGPLTLIVINKTRTALNSTIQLSNFNAESAARVYRYSAARLDAIEMLSDTVLNGGTAQMTFAPNSITLVKLDRVITEPTPMPSPTPVTPVPTATDIPVRTPMPLPQQKVYLPILKR
jgi:hypothetical protein